VNKTCYKTFGELYERTIARDQLILSLGYHLVVQWETPMT
jgi:hypothetical protein